MKTIHPKHFLRALRKVKITRDADGIALENLSAAPQKIFLGKPHTFSANYLRVKFFGQALNDAGQAATVRFINSRRQMSDSVFLNSEAVVKSLSHPSDPVLHLAYLRLPAHAKLKVKLITFEETERYEIVEPGNFKNDVLVITPLYPASHNPYSATFVASKVALYKEHGIKCDIAVVNSEPSAIYKYQFNQDWVHKITFDELRKVIREGHYKKILVHFINPQIANALNACNLSQTDILVYCHGADVDFWNNDIYTPYFSEKYIFNQDEIDYRNLQQQTLEEFDQKPNVTWVFNTEWNLQNARRATGLDFARHEIIPCIINERTFPYKKRTEKQKNKILLIKRMDNIRLYAVDIGVRIVLELAKKDFFKDLEITFVGTGDYQKELVSPLHQFSNVKIINKFICNDQLHKLFSDYSILLAPSRYDTQGVTSGEAAMSGMALVASKGTGLSDLISESSGTFFSNDNLTQAVKIIEQLYYGKKDCSKIGKAMHDELVAKMQSAVKNEIALLRRQPQSPSVAPSSDDLPKKPLLTIVIPAYNAAIYLENTIRTLVNQSNAHLLEIIVIDDGSTDDTEVVMTKLCRKFPKSILKYVKKENGGHGSTINKGLELAIGKYFRILDADDRLDSQALKQHLDYLQTTDTDIVFTNTILDRSIPACYEADHKYPFMEPHRSYDFDSLCYEHYGFPGYGVVLSTTSIKTEKLRSAGCRLTEKCFYVDMEFNYYATLAADTASFDPVNLYYYYLGRSDQSLAAASYKRNFQQYLKVSDRIMTLLEEDKLSQLKYEHFCRVQLKEILAHQYRIALDMIGTKQAYRDVEKMMSRHPRFSNDSNLIPGRVLTVRKYGPLWRAARRLGHFSRNRARTLKYLLFGAPEP